MEVDAGTYGALLSVETGLAFLLLGVSRVALDAGMVEMSKLSDFVATGVVGTSSVRMEGVRVRI